MKKNLLLILFSLALSLMILWPIKGVGDWYPMHDSTHPVRVLLMNKAISSGQFPPIWTDWANSGYGYPLFHFYAPLFHYLATTINFIMPTMITSSLKIVLLLSVFVGTLGCMIFAKRWGNLAAIVAGVSFVLAPYLATNLYVRGAFSEYLSLSLIPWVFLATEKINSKKRMILAALTLSLFVLSHNLIPILVLPMTVLWIIFNNRQKFSYSLGAVLLSIAISSWFVIPLIFERGFTKADEIARRTDYAFHFVQPWQMWNSTWGFGGSAPGVEDGMSFKLGKLQIILGILGLVIAAFQKKKKLILLGIFAFLAFFLAVPSSKIIWETIPALQIVQFPWRALGIISVILAILSGYAVSRFQNRVVRTGLTILVVVSLIFLNYKYFSPQSIITTPLDKSEISQEEVPDIAPLVAEYEPVWQKDPLPPSASYPRNANSQTILARAYYPTWIVKVDGRQVSTQPDENGLLSFANPTYSTNYQLSQSPTNLEKFSYGLTIISLLYLILLWRKSAKT